MVLVLLVATALFSSRAQKAAQREQARVRVAALCQADRTYDRARAPADQVDILKELWQDAREAARLNRRYASLADELRRAYQRQTAGSAEAANLPEALIHVRILCSEAAGSLG